MLKRTRTFAAVLDSAVALAVLPVAVPVPVARKPPPPREYVLKHPKREHCRAHYDRRVRHLRKRVHGRVVKRRLTVCVYRRTSTRVPLPWATPLTPASGGLGSVTAAPPTFTSAPPAPGPTCTTTFTGAESTRWAGAGNWTGGVPGGASSYGCVPAAYPSTVTFDSTSEVGGVSVQNPGGLALQEGRLTLASPSQQSTIADVQPGNATVTLGEGVTLGLTGESGALGGDTWNGPGAIEVPRFSVLKIGECTSWGFLENARCLDPGGGKPSKGHEGLQLRNFGTIYGAGLSLCQDGAAHPAVVENQGVIAMKESGGFAGAPDCGPVGSVLNGTRGVIALGLLDGNACNIVWTIASLENQGQLSLGSCYKGETEGNKLATLDIGGSFTETGRIRDNAIVHVHGDYAPGVAAQLGIGVRETLFSRTAPTTNIGQVEVDGNAALAGELNVETYPIYEPALGQTFQILHAAGELTGEFRLGKHCIPAEPGNGFVVHYKPGSNGTVTIEVAAVPGC